MEKTNTKTGFLTVNVQHNINNLVGKRNKAHTVTNERE